MSAHSYTQSIYSQMFGVTTPAPRRTKAKIEFAEFVRPDCYWPQPYTLEQAFQVYRWFVRTASPYTQRWGYNPFDILIGRGVINSSGFDHQPVRSISQLQQIFHRAILARSNGPRTDAWRTKERIKFGESRILHFPHYAPFAGSPVLGHVCSEAQIQTLLEAYFSAQGNLIVQLNSCHADAVEIWQLGIRVSAYDFQFKFDLEYGVDGSSWKHSLASGEQFVDTFAAALQEFQRVSGQDLLGKV